jgi:hypothetical protein
MPETTTPGSQDARDGWKPGDRVRLLLPDDNLPRGRGRAERWFSGTVAEVDPPGNRPGVFVDLDETVNGVRTCFATHRELRADVGESRP